jgi:hypothetical protein
MGAFSFFVDDAAESLRSRGHAVLRFNFFNPA